jgi:hypothetical protein
MQLHFFAGAGNPRFDCADRGIGGLTNFLVGQSFHVSQNDYLVKLDWQFH